MIFDILALVLLVFVVPVTISYFLNFSVFKFMDLLNSRKSVNHR